jgi:hypothetical protein
MTTQGSIIELDLSEIDAVAGGPAQIGAAALGAAAAVGAVAVAAFTVGYSIGRDLGKAIFRN